MRQKLFLPLTLTVLILGGFAVFAGYNYGCDGCVLEVAPPPVAEAPVPGLCPAGWADNSAREEHSRVFSCKRDKWIVVLYPDGSFNYGFQVDTVGAEFIYRPTDVPGW